MTRLCLNVGCDTMKKRSAITFDKEMNREIVLPSTISSLYSNDYFQSLTLTKAYLLFLSIKFEDV